MRVRRSFVWPLLLIGGQLLALPGAARARAQVEVRIVRPQADATVQGTEVTVELEVEGVVLGGRARNGAYALLTLDDLPPVKSFSRRFTFRGVEGGDHLLVVELRRADGTRFEPAASARVRFTTASPRGGGRTRRDS